MLAAIKRSLPMQIGGSVAFACGGTFLGLHAAHLLPGPSSAALLVVGFAFAIPGLIAWAVAAVRLGTVKAGQANQRLESRLKELTLLFDLTRSLTSTLELEEMLRRLADLIEGTGSFSSFGILLADEEQRGLVVRTSCGIEDDASPVGRRLPIRGELAAILDEGGHAIRRADPAARRGLAGLGWAPDRASLLLMPMKHEDRAEGLLVFARPEGVGFSAADVELLRSVAGQAALAISNAQLFEKTVKLSLTDPLTGMFNRRHLFARLDLETLRARRYAGFVSVAMFDIDHFKNFNDTCGHAGGDVVLQEVARLLHSNVRRIDIVARFGGEEFCIILPNLRKEEAGAVAEKLRVIVEEAPFPFEEAQPGGKLTVSVGYATFPADGEDVDTLLDAADSALYASKRGGRNRSSGFDPAMELHPDSSTERRRNGTEAAAPDTPEPLLPGPRGPGGGRKATG